MKYRKLTPTLRFLIRLHKYLGLGVKSAKFVCEIWDVSLSTFRRYKRSI